MKLRWAVPLVFLTLLLLRVAGVAQNYAPAANYPTSTSPQGITKGDFNEDGKTDVVVVNSGAASLTFFPGNGDGTFAVGSSIVTGAGPFSVASADLNGDGHLDLVVSLLNSKAFEVLFGNGNGTFQAAQTISISGLTPTTTVGQVLIADLNHDNRPDIAIATDFGIALFINTGGTFAQFSYVDGTKTVANIALGDIDNDGSLDIVGTESGVDVNGNTTGNLFYALGNGDGTFQTPSYIFFVNGTPAGLALADFNKDGHLDIALSDSGEIVSGSGGVSGCTPRICIPRNIPGNPNPLFLPGAITVFMQQAGLTFSTAPRITSDQHPGFIAVGDLNGDGNPDIVDASEGVASLSIFAGQGNGTFSPPLSLTIPSSAAEVATAAIADPVAIDLVASDNATNQISVFVNRGANSLNFSSSPNPSQIGQSVALTAIVQPRIPTAGTLSGSVIFADGANTLGTAPVGPTGSSSLTTSFNSAGNHTLVAVYSGNASFVGGTSAQVTQVVRSGPPTVTLSSSLNPSSYGQPVSFTVTVSAGAAGAGDNINLLDNGSVITSGALDPTGKVVLTSSTLGTGTNVLVAHFSGDSILSPADSPQLTQTVNKTNTTTSITSSLNPSVFGQPVTLTISVAPAIGNGAPTGTVTVVDGNVNVGTAALDANGKAVLTLNSLSPRLHLLSATYAGDANFNSSSSAAGTSVDQVVSPSTTSVTLSSSANPSVFGQVVGLTATIRAVSGGGIPSGPVSFREGTVVLGSANVDNTGLATLSLNSLSVGTHSITADYAGNVGYQASSSAPLSQVVKQNATVITFSSNPNPSTFGGGVTLTIITAPAVPAVTGVATGTIAISDGGAVLGSITLDATGKGSLSVTSLNVGTHVLTANYSGDVNFTPASASVNQLVNKAPTSTVLSTSINPASNASVVNMTATVTSNAGVPAGSVSFFDGATLVGSTQLNATGGATISVSNLTVGTHSLSAVYAGTTNLASSQSATVSEKVVDSQSTVSLTSSVNPQVVSQPVTFTATVIPALSSQTLSGTITFSDGQQLLAKVPVSGSVATFTTSSLSVGSHLIVAAYQAGANPGPLDGISAGLSETIDSGTDSNAPDFTIALQQPTATMSLNTTFVTKAVLTPKNGFTGPVTLSCLGLPSGASCTFSPNPGVVNGTGSTMSQLRIQAVSSEDGSSQGHSGKPTYPLPKPSPLMFMGPALLGCVLTKKGRRGGSFLAMVVVIMVGMTACGGSKFQSVGDHLQRGTYTVTVQGLSGKVVHSTQLQLTIR